MSLSRIQMIAKGRQVPFFAEPEFSSADHAWVGFSFEEARSSAEPLPAHSWPKTTLLYVTGGEASLQWKHRGVWHEDPCRRGTVSIVRRAVEIESAASSQPFPMLIMQLDNLKLHHIAPDYVLTIERSLAPVQVTQDGRLAALMSAMCEEVREGCPSGRLFGESLSLALLAYLAGTYATPRPPDCDASNLSPSQRRIVVGYVRSHLAGSVCVSELAALVQMSPSHFARVFRASFGVTPYRFVMQERIGKAKGMLAEAEMSASQIAMALGFSSQSHFAKVFRQFTGVTPKRYKASF